MVPTAGLEPAPRLSLTCTCLYNRLYFSVGRFNPQPRFPARYVGMW